MGQEFGITAEGVSFSVVLLSVDGPAGTTPPERPFAVTFVGGPNPPVAQGLHRLNHPSLGALELFLVAVGPGPDGRHRYEAVFG